MFNLIIKLSLLCFFDLCLLQVMFNIFFKVYTPIFFFQVTTKKHKQATQKKIIAKYQQIV